MTETRRAMRREIWRLAWPVAVQSLLQSLMFFVDTLMVGTLPAEEGRGQPLAALQLCGPLLWSTSVIFTFFGVGTAAVVSRAVGERNPARARAAAAAALRMALGTGLAAAAIGWALAEGAIDLNAGVGVHDGTRRDAILYLRIFSLSFPAYFCGLAALSALRGAGDTVSPMAAGIAANLLNAVLNYALIHGRWGFPAWGVPGAAAATAVSHVLTIGILAGVMLRPDMAPFRWIRSRKAPGLALSGGDLAAWDAAQARSVLRVSLPSLVEALTVHSAFLVFQHVINHISEAAMAAHRIAITLESVAFLTAQGIYVASATWAGQRLGEGRGEDAALGVNHAAKLGAGCFLLISAAFVLFPEALAAPFLSAGGAGREETLRLAAASLRIGAIEVPMIAAAMAFYGGFRGSGATRLPVLVSLVGGWILRVPLAWWLGIHLGWGLPGVWVATAIDWTARAALYLLLFRHGGWKKAVV